MAIKLVIGGALLLLAAGCTVSPTASPAYSYGSSDAYYGNSGAYYAGSGVGYGTYYASPGYYGRPVYSGYGTYGEYRR
jgi:hypothetical protein